MSIDKNLFHLIRESDQSAFEVLFRFYYQPLKQFAYGMCKDDEVAEDIVQEVFIQLWENRTSIENTAPKSYLYSLVRNRTLNHLRHLKVKQKHTEEILHTTEETIREEPEDNEQLAHIFNAIEKLPAQCKKVFIMSRMNGLKHKEIAEELNISIKTVKNQIGKALKTIREDLQGVDMLLIISVIKFLSEKV